MAMRKVTILASGAVLAMGALAGLACQQANDVVGTAPEETSAGLAAASGPTGGSCPDVYTVSSKTLSNGAIVEWTSSFGGYNYTLGSDYRFDVQWWVTEGTASFVGFGPRGGHKNTWTPGGRDPVDGNVTSGQPADGSLPVTVTSGDMHRSVEDEDGDGVPEWMGEIGNGHFWLELDVDDGMGNVVRAKLGVNVHLEDPDEGFPVRCP